MRQHGLQYIHESAKNTTALYYTDGYVEQDGRSGAASMCSVRDAGDTAAHARIATATTFCANVTTVAGPPATAATSATATTSTITTSAAWVTDFSSTTQAELAAIKLAVDHARTSHKLDVLINTDSARWIGEVDTDDPRLPRLAHTTRRLELVRSRINLGYPYAWELEIATPEEKRRCRPCDEQNGHKLEHYLRGCECVNTLREKCNISNPTLPDLARHFLNILTETLSGHPKFCDINK
ncbi:hypothetical protein E2C01_067475 [Portunus trituberculatus]|uniref:RNase H type-1 domain-containing protein n=1 Tax=Portunus trituberculatus TaxID=210409 RepID=A0A5B7HV53_PORTR|nr:hypothetical protein [Portunus trituberculatus]